LTDQLEKRGIVGSFKKVIIGSDNVSENVSGGAFAHVTTLLRRSFKDNKSSRGSEIKESEGKREKAEEKPKGVLLVRGNKQQEDKCSLATGSRAARGELVKLRTRRGT